MTGFEPVRQARAAWERTQPQLFLELSEVTASQAQPSGAASAGQPPAAPRNTNGSGDAHSEGARATGARQEHILDG